MDATEQRYIIKFFFLSGMRYKSIYTEMKKVLHDNTVHLSTVKRWCTKFKNGHFSCEDEDHPGRPPSDLVGPVSKCLSKQPFISARQIAKQLSISPMTILRVLNVDMGLKRFTRKWVPHELTVEQKNSRVEKSKLILNILEKAQKNNFVNVMTGDESLFYFRYQSSHMYAESKEKVPNRISKKIDSKKVMITMFFNGNSLLCFDMLPKGKKYNQEYFINNIIEEIKENTDGDDTQMDFKKIMVHMDNCRVHTGKKVTQKLSNLKVKTIPHPAYSPDISPCDFWLFGFLKKSLEDKEILDEIQLKIEILNAWEHVTFEQLQNVFYEWMKRLKWVIDNKGEYYIN